MKDTRVETLQTNDFAMDYIRFGRGSRTLVILPGLSVESVTKSAEPVANAYSPLAEHFTVYVFDRRKSLPQPYPVANMAEDTVVAIRNLGLDRISLFGASQGGMMAMVIAARYPDLVEKLVLVSTSPFVEETQYQTLAEWVRLAQSGDAPALYQAFGNAVYPPPIAEQVQDLLAASANTVTKEELGRFVVLAEGTRGFDARDELQNITCPVLLIGSSDDHVLGTWGTEEIASRLNGHAGFELHRYDGYGHASYDTAPDFKERLLRFLK